MSRIVRLKKKVFKLDGTDSIIAENPSEYEYLYYTEDLDSEGNMISRTTYDKNGDPERRIERKYDGNILIEERLTHLQDNFEETDIYEYNKSGQKIKEFKIYDTEKELHRSYDYDDRGNLVEIIDYFDGQKQSKSTIEYDVDNREILRTNYSFDDNQTEIEKTEYDESGNIIRTINEYYDNNDGLSESDNRFITSYEYDWQNRLISKVMPVDNYKEDTLYDERGRVSEEICYQKSEIVSKNNFKYDDNDRVIYSSNFYQNNGKSGMYGGDGDRNSSYSLRYEYEPI